MEALIGKGLDVAIYDQNVSTAKLIGANKEFIEKKIPHISKLIKASLEEVIHNSEIIIVGNKSTSEEAIIGYVKPEQIIFDMVRFFKTSQKLKAKYFGIC